MPDAGGAPAAAIHNSKGDFALEPDAEPGMLPAAVIEELRLLRSAQNDAATDFREAVKVQSEKHKLKAGAVRKFIVALGRDKIDEARAEAQDIESLIDKSGN